MTPQPLLTVAALAILASIALSGRRWSPWWLVLTLAGTTAGFAASLEVLVHGRPWVLHGTFALGGEPVHLLLDAVSDITGLGDTFSAMPAGSRANQLWTTRVQSVFLDTFGRPNPNQDPPCERMSDTTVTQTLHLMNAPQLHQRVTSDNGRAAKLAADKELSPDQIVEELYLLVYSRLPDEAEREIGRQLFAEKETTRRQAAEDLLWALLNTPEFMFKD